MKRVILLIIMLSILTSCFFVTSAVDLETTAKDLGSITFSVYDTISKTYLISKQEYKLQPNDTALSILNYYKSEITIFSDVGYLKGIKKGNKSYMAVSGTMIGWVYFVNGSSQGLPGAASYYPKSDYPKSENNMLEWKYGNWVAPTVAPTTTTIPDKAIPTETISDKAIPTISAMTPAVSSTMFTYTAPYQQTYNSVDNYKFQLYNYVPSAITYVKNNPGNFTAYALSLYERSMPSVVQKRLIEEAVSGKLYTTDIERLIINLIACKINPSTYRNLDFINKLFNTAKIGEQGLNSTVFALLIYGGLTTTPKNVLWNRDKLIKEMMDAQHEDGGFALNKTDESDVDVTAMAVTALSKYKEQPKVKASIDSAINWLSGKQNSDGTYSSMGFSNCESTSQVLISLCSAGISLNDARFIKEKTIIDGFVSFYNGNAFVHVKDGGSDTFANEQALIAINACQINANPYRLALIETAPVKTNNNLPLILGLSVLFLVMVGGVVVLVLRRAGVIKF